MNFNVYENYPKLCSALIIAVLVYPGFFFVFVMLKFFLVFIYHSKQMLILKKDDSLWRPQII